MQRQDDPRDSVILSVSAGARAVLSIKGDMPAVLQAHGTSLGEFLGKIRDPAAITRLKALRNASHVPGDLLMYRRFDGVVAVSQAVAEDFEHRIVTPFTRGVPLRIIANGVDTKIFCRDEQRRRLARQRLGLPAGARVVLFASRLHWQKGLQVVQEAVARLRRPEIYLLIVGDGPDRRGAAQRARALQIESRCVFTGALDHAELPAMFDAADVFTQCSQTYEGLPLSLLEAMASDLPVVLSSFIAQRLQGAQGLVGVQADDVKDVKRGLEHALRTRKGGRSFVLQHHRQDQMLAAYENFLQQTLDRRR